MPVICTAGCEKRNIRKIEVVDYNPAWPELFIKEFDILQKTLKGAAIAIHHIGCTAVFGIAAKPIIDIIIEITNPDVLDKLNIDMEGIGYKPKEEFGIVGRRYFQKGGDERTHHVHAFIVGDKNEKNIHSLFFIIRNWNYELCPGQSQEYRGFILSCKK